MNSQGCLKNSSSRTRTLHGAVDITYQVTNDVQQEVDDLIDAASTDSASTPTSEDGPSPSEAANGLGNPERDNRDEEELNSCTVYDAIQILFPIIHFVCHRLERKYPAVSRAVEIDQRLPPLHRNDS